MQPDAMILSILNRYENNLPVTAEEKAVLHKWLIKSLRTRDFIPPSHISTPMKIKEMRKKLPVWQYAFIILTLIAIGITLYMFAVKTRKASIKKSDDNVHSYYPEVRTTGRENRVEFSRNSRRDC